MNYRLHINRKKMMADGICILLMTCYTSLCMYNIVYLPDILVFIFPLFYGIYVADEKWYVVTFWSIIIMLLFLLIISLSLHLFISIPGINYNELMGNSIIRLVFVVSTNMVLTLIVCITKQISRDYSRPYWSILGLFLLVIISLLIIEESLYYLQIDMEFENAIIKSSFFWGYMGLLFCTVGIVSLFHIMMKSIEKEHCYRGELASITQTKQYQKELEQLYDRLITIKHDIKHHFQIMESILIHENQEKMREYFNEYLKKSEMTDLFHTGSQSVDALLLAKSIRMKQKNIEFRYSPYPLDSLPIDETDFCTLLGNILDNAIEGVLRIDSANITHVINLAFSRSWDMFYIYCKNPCNESTIISESEGLLSSKRKDSLKMGIGMRSIKRIVYMSEGRYTYSIENGFFVTKIVLPYIVEENNNDTAAK